MKITSARIGEPGGGSASTLRVTHFSGGSTRALVCRLSFMGLGIVTLLFKLCGSIDFLAGDFRILIILSNGSNL